MTSSSGYDLAILMPSITIMSCRWIVRQVFREQIVKRLRSQGGGPAGTATTNVDVVMGIHRANSCLATDETVHRQLANDGSVEFLNGHLMFIL